MNENADEVLFQQQTKTKEMLEENLIWKNRFEKEHATNLKKEDVFQQIYEKWKVATVLNEELTVLQTHSLTEIETNDKKLKEKKVQDLVKMQTLQVSQKRVLFLEEELEKEMQRGEAVQASRLELARVQTELESRAGQLQENQVAQEKLICKENELMERMRIWNIEKNLFEKEQQQTIEQKEQNQNKLEEKERHIIQLQNTCHELESTMKSEQEIHRKSDLKFSSVFKKSKIGQEKLASAKQAHITLVEKLSKVQQGYDTEVNARIEEGRSKRIQMEKVAVLQKKCTMLQLQVASAEEIR